MHLLLPPSEAKTSGGRGRPLRARADDGPLAQPRRHAIAALLDLVRTPGAAQALLLPPAVAARALEIDATVLDSPTTPALKRYAGTVYDGLGFAGLDPAAQRTAGRCVLIFSGLLGVVRGSEPVPEYRVPAKAVLPGLGVAGTYWRPILDTILPGMVGKGLVVDLRSTDYASMWRPRRAVRVRVLSPVNGRYAVVSFTSKHAKGRLAAELITRRSAGQQVRTPEDVADAWRACGGVRSLATRDGLDLYTA